MSGVNKVFLVGRLGADPEVKTTSGGQQVATFSIATSESWTGRDGNRQEKTEWHRVVVWEKLAELAGKFLQKGSQVCIEGKIQTRSWDDQQSGQKRYSTEIVGQQMTFLGEPNRGGETRSEPRAEPRSEPAQGSSGKTGTEPGYFDGHVPF